MDSPSGSGTTPIPNSSRLPGLDGLRAIAVGLVIISHYVPDNHDGTMFSELVNKGGFGVQIFFVLSGYLITHLILKEEVSAGHLSIPYFYIRRALRILPPLIAFLAFLAAASAIGLISVPTIDLVAGLFFVRNFFGSAPITGHLWTLAIEEQFYLAWPLIIVLVRSIFFRVILTATIVAVSPFWRQLNYMLADGAANLSPVRTDFQLAPLAVGALLALLDEIPASRRLLRGRFTSGPTALTAACAVLLLFLLTPALDQKGIRLLSGTITSLAVAVVINCCVRNRHAPWTRLLEWKPIALLGVLSYSIYLWQQPFAPYIPEATSAWFRECPINLCLALGFAITSYLLVERPFLSLRRHFRHVAKEPSASNAIN